MLCLFYCRGFSLAVVSAGFSLRWLLWLQSTGSQAHEASVVAARGLRSCGYPVSSTGSQVVANWPSCSVACGILPDPGSNPHPLCWQADSQTLSHQGSSRDQIFKIILLQINSCNKLFSCSGYDCIMSKHLGSKNFNYFGVGPTYCHRKQTFM